MNAPINHQIIKDETGKPAFVVISYNDYLNLTGNPRPKKRRNESDYIPHEIVDKHLGDGKSLVRSWREHLHLTQREMGQLMNITQAAYSHMEKPNANLQPETLTRIASALGIDLGLLTLED
ncbi:helix-turn-helix transcriptional regulator [Desulfoluna sp.]|uniref:helix-turn-helix domain-containing protein n=1 Tax=Desulfoluna sp. TaxID=2045199 RepID=UPI002621908C|nr:helix-turn-helix transcriptional regulator [Desulfoluna sp.]